MRVLSKTTIVVFGLVLLMLLGCSSDNQSEIKTGSLNLFTEDKNLVWTAVFYESKPIDSSESLIDHELSFNQIDKKIDISNDSLQVFSFNDTGISVKFDSLIPGIYDVMIYVYTEELLDSALNVDNLPEKKFFRPILLTELIIKKGNISTCDLDSKMKLRHPDSSDFYNSQTEMVLIVKWKEKFIPIKQEKVASTTKAFG